ncbi:tyrosine-protein phosphatase YwqE [Maribacter vaceletii]|uniref:protein-tyrosine-phosphatase n=1 Tax=Maribacter vaceletii TaxID=1206816 RepID=A0A495E792_9FLAO|nr:CpsB/CapC family capsule biosynthesis tyrosine phosphatase [Maribacter vaceletii]RKR12808.1 tyrosine-protein phosphatase YwqE [Maribacter vaceletii]
MFSFFEKKTFLIDHLNGFTDIHNHILPGIDDGAKTVEDSIELIKGFSEFGVTNFIATPHIMHNYYPNTHESITKASVELKKELAARNMNSVSISIAAEHMIDANFETILKDDEVMPLEKSYLLVEMSYLQASINFDNAIKKISEKRLFPILAHPERYVYLHPKFRKYEKYKRNGIMFQLNLLSLSTYYGKDVQKTANRLLNENLIDFAGSDIHNIRQLNSLKEIKLTKKQLQKIQPVIEKTNQSFY